MVVHTVHYLKRILETIFVHQFSHATMPIFNLFKNCSYYWGFAVHELLHQPPPVHARLRRSRCSPASASLQRCAAGQSALSLVPGEPAERRLKAYKEPKGGLFKYVTCANYACEIYQWIGFNVATQSAWGGSSCCAVFQMYFWAIVKHKCLKKLFPGFKRAFKLLPPFV